jgi:hypothetical protein
VTTQHLQELLKLSPEATKAALIQLEQVGLIARFEGSQDQWKSTQWGEVMHQRGNPANSGRLSPQELQGLVDLEQQELDQSRERLQKQLETFEAELKKVEQGCRELIQRKGKVKTDAERQSLERQITLEQQLAERMSHRLEQARQMVETILTRIREKEDQLMEARLQIRLMGVNQSLSDLQSENAAYNPLPEMAQQAQQSAMASLLKVIQHEYHRSEALFSLEQPPAASGSAPAPLDQLLSTQNTEQQRSAS